MKTKLLNILRIFIIQLFLLPFFLVILLYYGPFDNVRGLVVYTSMNTATHQWISTSFLSETKINSIINQYKTILKSPKQDISQIKIKYADSSEIEILDVQAGLSKGKLMIVKNPFMLTLGLTKNQSLVDETLSEIVARNKALGGINAGGVMQNESLESRRTLGIIVQNGEIINWEFEWESTTIIGMNYNGFLIVKDVSEQNEVNSLNLNFGVSFGPCLISNGKKMVVQTGPALQPRTAIAQRKDGAILLLVLDGRYIDSAGATLKDVQDILYQHCAWNAANLDGGSSTTMIYKGDILNRPSDTFEREISSAFLVIPNEK